MDQIRVMANEWLKALRTFGVQTVHRATTKCIQESKWWPALAEVVALCRSDEDGWRDALGIKDERRHHAEPLAFAQDGRTEAEEIAYRAAQVASMKREAGINLDAGNSDTVTPREVAAASQSAGVSFQIRNSCAARRARREKTCEENCAKQRCALRESEAMRADYADARAIDSQSPPTASERFDDAEHG